MFNVTGISTVGMRPAGLRRTGVLALVAALALGACGGSASSAPSNGPAGSTAAGETTTPGTASQGPGTSQGPGGNPADFSTAASALANLDSYKFDVEIQTSSAGTNGIEAGSTSFSGIVVNKPAAAQTLNMVEKDATGTVTSATSYIVTTDKAWVKDGADGTFQEIPAAQAGIFLQSLSIFRPEQLFSMYFLPGATDNTAVGDEQKNGVDTTHYKGGEAIGAILSSIAGVNGQWSSDVWLAKDGGYLVHSEASVASATASEGGSFSIVVDITDINASSNVVSGP